MNKRKVPAPQAARVLVVDDELHVRSALARSLRIVGYQAEEAESGDSALDMLASSEFDVMVLDLQMPGIHGVEVMQRIQQINPELLVIILTGNATLESAIAAVKCGAADYLLKPTSVHDVAQAVTKALQSRAETLRRELIETVSHALDSLQRGRSPESLPLLPAQSQSLTSGPVTLDREKRLVVVAGTPPHTAEVTDSEAAILSYLMERPEETVSCHELAISALGYDVTAIEALSIVRPHISRLRHKLTQHAGQPDLVRTVRRKGYFFSPGKSQ